MIKKKRAMIAFGIIMIIVCLLTIVIASVAFLTVPKDGNYPNSKDFHFQTFEEAIDLNVEGRDVKVIDKVKSGNFELVMLEEKMTPNIAEKYFVNNIKLLYTDGNKYVGDLADYSFFSFSGWRSNYKSFANVTPPSARIETAYVGGKFVCAIAIMNQKSGDAKWTVRDSENTTFIESCKDNGDRSATLYLATMDEAPKDYKVFINDFENTLGFDAIKPYIIGIAFFTIIPAVILTIIGLFAINYHYSKKQKKELQKLKD
ncbi:MAG: hypothetical protein RR348_01570, partial [Clostridia bacterium]